MKSLLDNFSISLPQFKPVSKGFLEKYLPTLAQLFQALHAERDSESINAESSAVKEDFLWEDYQSYFSGVYNAGSIKSAYQVLDGVPFSSPQFLQFLLTDWFFMMYKMTFFLFSFNLLTWPFPNFLPLAGYLLHVFNLVPEIFDSGEVYNNEGKWFAQIGSFVT